MKYHCPKCKSTNLFVLISTFARLHQYGEDEFETDVGGDHEWDDDSAAICRDCPWTGSMQDCDTQTKE